MSQTKLKLGTIGEHMVMGQLLLQGYDCFNANFSIQKNTEYYDLVCINAKGETALVQVKTTEKNGGWPISISIKQAQQKAYIESRVKGPWVFVKKDGEGINSVFHYYILSREQVIDMIYEGHDWYINKLQHRVKLNLDAICTVQEEWLRGQDCVPKRLNGPTFINPLKGISSEEAWDNIWK